MLDKRSLYAENVILPLEVEEGVTVECGILGLFELDGKLYIALNSLDEDSLDIYLYNYVPTDDDFDLVYIPEEEFDRVAAAFNCLMDESL